MSCTPADVNAYHDDGPSLGATDSTQILTFRAPGENPRTAHAGCRVWIAQPKDRLLAIACLLDDMANVKLAGM
jgi:hypothetical protein